MPTYEYACKQCGEHFEVVQSFSDESLTVCALCGGPLRKVFGSVGIVFKGSGFYKNDSRSTSSRAKDSERSESAGNGKDSPKKAETPASSAASSSSNGSSTSTPSTAASPAS